MRPARPASETNWSLGAARGGTNAADRFRSGNFGERTDAVSTRNYPSKFQEHRAPVRALGRQRIGTSRGRSPLRTEIGNCSASPVEAGAGKGQTPFMYRKEKS